MRTEKVEKKEKKDRKIMKKMTKIRKTSAVFPLFYAGTPRNAPKPPIFVKTPKIGVYTGGYTPRTKLQELYIL